MERKKSYFHSEFKSYYYCNFHKNLGSKNSGVPIVAYAGRPDPCLLLWLRNYKRTVSEMVNHAAWSSQYLLCYEH